MADVLSQSQIDALLSAAASGTLEEEVEEKKTKKYDFHTPKKFTKDRLRLISGVYENYARLIASHLTSIMRMDIEVELLAVEEQRYYEFNNALMEDDVLAFVEPTSIATQEMMDPVLIQMSIPVIHGFVDRMLGGTGDNDPISDSNNTITDVEMVLYENLISKIAPVMGDVWESYMDIDFKFQRMEVNPRLVQAIGMEEIVVIVALSVRINEVYGQLNVCLPAELLDFIFKRIEESASLLSRKKESQTAEEKQLIMMQIEESKLDIVARLAPKQILLKDLFHMREGDIINLAIPVGSPVLVDVGGQQWFYGKMGTFKGNKAIVMDSVLAHDDSVIKGER